MTKPSRHAAVSPSSNPSTSDDGDDLARWRKLPRWAREEITILRNREASLRDALAEASGDIKISAVEINPLNPHLDLPRQFLRNDASVRFYLQNGYVTVRIDPKGEAININADFSRGYGDTVIMPNSSNDFRVALIRTDKLSR